MWKILLGIVLFPFRVIFTLVATLFVGVMWFGVVLMGLFLGMGILALCFLALVIFFGFFGGLVVLICHA